MRNIDMIWKCNMCRYHQAIHYSNGAVGIGCLAYNVESPYPVDITRIAWCPLGKDGKK